MKFRMLLLSSALLLMTHSAVAGYACVCSSDGPVMLGDGGSCVMSEIPEGATPSCGVPGGMTGKLKKMLHAGNPYQMLPKPKPKPIVRVIHDCTKCPKGARGRILLP